MLSMQPAKMSSSSSDMSDSDVSTDHLYSDESTSASEDEMSGGEAEGERAPEAKATKPDDGEKDGTKKRSRRTPGVVYLSRIPPYMKPHKLRHLLSPYGTVGHIFLQPEGE